MGCWGTPFFGIAASQIREKKHPTYWREHECTGSEPHAFYDLHSLDEVLMIVSHAHDLERCSDWVSNNRSCDTVDFKSFWMPASKVGCLQLLGSLSSINILSIGLDTLEWSMILQSLAGIFLSRYSIKPLDLDWALNQWYLRIWRLFHLYIFCLWLDISWQHKYQS